MLSSKYKTRAHDDSYDPTDSPEEDDLRKKRYGDEMEQLWYGGSIENQGITNLSRYIEFIIVSKRFIQKLMSFDYDDTMFHKEFVQQYKNNWTYETSPMKKVQELTKFIKDTYNIDLKIEK